MTDYYVGPGGNDGNSGLTWALRKLTLNGAEDVPVVAGDTVYVGPGVYREQLTVDVSGNAGNPIVYIGDVTGENTDGIGGIVRITGSDNDQTTARYSCIAATTKDYRTFRGFTFDTASSRLVDIDDCDYWIIEDCTFNCTAVNSHQIYVDGTSTYITIRRCAFATNYYYNIYFIHSSTVDDSGHIVENCILLGSGSGIRIDRIGGITVRNVVFQGAYLRIFIAIAIGQTTTVNGCIFIGGTLGVFATALGEITENYNTFYGISTARTNVAVGANSVTYPPLFDLGLLHAGASQASGFRLPPPRLGELMGEWSQVAAIADGGTNAALDISGLTRPVTDGKRSYGAVQWQNQERDTATVYSGVASLEFSDYGRQQFWVCSTNAVTTVTVQVYLEANYAGNAPQMIIKQPGQADRTTTATGATGAWEELTDTFTPAADPEWFIVELVSRNTAAAGNYAVYFDALTVT